ncbi:hypothetical protein MT356_09475 [Rathayibacter festucae]|uniref:hypothetical protein n=1 Tax=Rathayibacter festucae TaxID=110937 RepID=UPI001FB33305|nr:hypothetical protein [Rathayibacter festucae]MCJ1699952.1 hypothetical protein [Rathayibacter festucae]
MDEFWGELSEWLTGQSNARLWNWGSTAEWVTGLLTAAAVLLAVLTFNAERTRERQSQADKIVVRVRPQADATLKATIKNYSDSDISDVSIIFRSLEDIRFVSVVYVAVLESLFTTGLLSGSIARFMPTSFSKAILIKEAAFTEIGPKESEKVVVVPPHSRNFSYVAHITFTDYKGVEWARDLRRNKYVQDPEVFFYFFNRR